VAKNGWGARLTPRAPPLLVLARPGLPWPALSLPDSWPQMGISRFQGRVMDSTPYHRLPPAASVDPRQLISAYRASIHASATAIRPNPLPPD